VLNAKLRVFLNCVDKHSEMPNKSFFKQVLEPGLIFEEDGKLSADQKLFSRMFQKSQSSL